jgi:GTPase SAR1 family protein
MSELWSDLTPPLIRTSVNIYKNRKEIQHWYKRFQVFANLGSTNILVLGRPNVGKTVLVSQLYEETSKLSFDLPQTSKDVETKAITFGDWTKIVRIIPGQDTRAKFRGLRLSLQNNNDLDGVIYVCDWGFTDVRDNIVKQSFIERDKIETIETLRVFNLEKELEDFREVCKEIQKAYLDFGKGPKWIIVVSNKVDLYYSSIDDAQKYYHNAYQNAFSDIANETIAKIGEQRIKYTAIPICAYQKSLEWNKHTVNTNLGGDEIQKSLLKNLMSKIVELTYGN